MGSGVFFPLKTVKKAVILNVTREKTPDPFLPRTRRRTGDRRTLLFGRATMSPTLSRRLHRTPMKLRHAGDAAYRRRSYETSRLKFERLEDRVLLSVNWI